MASAPTTLKPVEVWYQGKKYRSKMEARWRIVLDGIAWPVEYEHETYETSAGWYIPDFDIGQQQFFLEVKGKPQEGRDKARALAVKAWRPVVIARGNPRFVRWDDSDDDEPQLDLYLPTESGVFETAAFLLECERCHRVGIYPELTGDICAVHAVRLFRTTSACNCGDYVIGADENSRVLMAAVDRAIAERFFDPRGQMWETATSVRQCEYCDKDLTEKQSRQGNRFCCQQCSQAEYRYRDAVRWVSEARQRGIEVTTTSTGLAISLTPMRLTLHDRSYLKEHNRWVAAAITGKKVAA